MYSTASAASASNNTTTSATDLSRFINVEDIRHEAVKKLTANARNYYESGANGQHTLQENINAYHRIRIRPRVLRPVSKVNTSITLLNQFNISSPICIAPTAMQRMACPEGECDSARASVVAKTAMILSSLSTSSIEEVAQAVPNMEQACLWFQLYVYKDRNVTAALVKRAEAAGYKAIVVTVDTPFLGRREADVRNKFVLPSHLKLANFNPETLQAVRVNVSQGGSGLQEYVATLMDPDLTWDDIAALKKSTKLPILLKGILTAEDAMLALDAGVDGIIVSNHGARQLDFVPSTIEALPEVVEAVRGRVPIFLDGGVRTGTDVFKAIALGAQAVFIGRPVLYGLSVAGKDGVLRVLQLMNDELKLAMALAGCPNIASINRKHVTSAMSYWSKL